MNEKLPRNLELPERSDRYGMELSKLSTRMEALSSDLERAKLEIQIIHEALAGMIPGFKAEHDRLIQLDTLRRMEG
jgi:hypothetical protein